VSLDVFVACAAAVTLPAQLPAEGAWKRFEDRGNVWFANEHINEAWQLIVWLEDDPKARSTFTLPAGKKHLVGFSLEGDSNKGLPLLEKTVDAITKSCDGVLLDT